MLTACFSTNRKGTDDAQPVPSDTVPTLTAVATPVPGEDHTSEEFIAAINNAWKEKYGQELSYDRLTHSFSNSAGNPIRCYDIKNSEFSILFEDTNLPGESSLTVGGYTFQYFKSFFIGVYNPQSQTVLDLEDAYEQGWLTGEDLAALLEKHDYVTSVMNVGQSKAPSAMPAQDLAPFLSSSSPFPVGFRQPASKVAKADPDTDKIPIGEAYFSDPVFCEFLKETYDTDKDGFLSKTEREQLTQLSLADMENRQNCRVLDGLDLFSNLKTLDVGGSYLASLEVYLYDHPGIERIWGVDSSGAVSLYIDGCENLQIMYFGGILHSCRVGLYAHNCKNLSDVNLRISSALTGSSQNRNKIYCLETPNLRLHLYESMSHEIWLDANAQVFPILRYDDPLVQEPEKNFTLTPEGIPYWTRMQSKKPVAYLNVNWLGLDSSTPTMKTEVEKVRAASEEYMTKKHTTVSSLTHFVGAILYSPKKTSVYAVESKYMESNDYVSLGTRYYIVEGNGTVLAYNSLQELADAADSRTDLPNNLYTFLTAMGDY